MVQDALPEDSGRKISGRIRQFQYLRKQDAWLASIQ
jgi:hypothetical protein